MNIPSAFLFINIVGNCSEMMDAPAENHPFSDSSLKILVVNKNIED